MFNDTSTPDYTYKFRADAWDQDWKQKAEEDPYISTKIALFEYFVAWESVYLSMKQAAFDWLKIWFNKD